MPVPDFVLELRKQVGQAQLWLPGITAVVRRAEEVLLVRRSDNGQWAPITGIVEPGEDPGVTARRETYEETRVVVTVDRLAMVSVTPPVTHVNGDLAIYLDHAFACTWVGGEAVVGDDESVDVQWWPRDQLPPMKEELAARIEIACAAEERTRFRS
ncbi:MAG TPA: NUDIX domain-containing protein [Nocardioides sp.]|nr:NUDIX domain-containing protein [Nocardioides sp.]